MSPMNIKRRIIMENLQGMETLLLKIEQAGDLEKELKALKDRVDSLKTDIKFELEAKNISSIESAKYKASYYPSTTITYLDTAVDFLKAKNIDAVVEKVDKDKLEAFIKVGIVAPEDVAPFKVIKTTLNLRIS
jgi:hypothetical protein